MQTFPTHHQCRRRAGTPTCSTSGANTFSPPVLTTSLARPISHRAPSLLRKPTSPVRSQPPCATAARVAAASRQ
eukprot:51458-Chlamydomonas_euryale.AAC.6